jgi:hypothetical protein
MDDSIKRLLTAERQARVAYEGIKSQLWTGHAKQVHLHQGDTHLSSQCALCQKASKLVSALDAIHGDLLELDPTALEPVVEESEKIKQLETYIESLEREIEQLREA